jgi:hypothetical protein
MRNGTDLFVAGTVNRGPFQHVGEKFVWWVSHDDHGAFAARGVHGQTVWVDPAANMVIVRFASNPMAGNAASDPTLLPAYRAVADYLMAQEDNAQLVGREWFIEDIAGNGVMDNSQASLLLSMDAWPEMRAAIV